MCFKKFLSRPSGGFTQGRLKEKGDIKAFGGICTDISEPQYFCSISEVPHGDRDFSLGTLSN